MNQRLFATVSGSHQDPAITGEGGRELTPEEGQVLQHIMQLTGGVFGMFHHLLQPAGSILGLEMLR